MPNRRDILKGAPALITASGLLGAAEAGARTRAPLAPGSIPVSSLPSYADADPAIRNLEAG